MAGDEVVEGVADRARVDGMSAPEGEQWSLGVASPGTMRDLCDVLGQLRPEPRPEGDESVLVEMVLSTFLQEC